MANKYIILGVALMFVAVANARPDGLVGGGKQDQQPANDNVKALVQKLDADLKAKIKETSCASKACLNPDKLEALFVKEQTVSGTNYYVKIRAYEGQKNGIYHATIYEQPWTNTLEVTDMEGPKEESAPL